MWAHTLSGVQQNAVSVRTAIIGQSNMNAHLNDVVNANANACKRARLRSYSRDRRLNVGRACDVCVSVCPNGLCAPVMEYQSVESVVFDVRTRTRMDHTT